MMNRKTPGREPDNSSQENAPDNWTTGDEAMLRSTETILDDAV